MEETQRKIQLEQLIEQYNNCYTRKIDLIWLKRFLTYREQLKRSGMNRYYEIPNETLEDKKKFLSWYKAQKVRLRTGKMTEKQLELILMMNPQFVLLTHQTKNQYLWETRFHELLRFKERYQHTNVPSTSKEYRKLSVWVMNQRFNYRRGILSKERIEALTQIGFQFRIVTETRSLPKCHEWNEYIEAFKKFKEEFGHVLVTLTYVNDEGIKLGSWMRNNIRLKHTGHLKKERIEELDAIGFCWSFTQKIWDYKCEELRSFIKREGHNLVFANHVEREYPNGGQRVNVPLSSWVRTQRELLTKGELTEEQIQTLNEIGIEWDNERECLISAAWLRNFSEYKQINNLELYIQDRRNQHYFISEWAKRQRRAYRNGELKAEQVELLNSIQFKWEFRMRKKPIVTEVKE